MSRSWWPRDINNVASCKADYDIDVMVCDARKMDEIKATYNPRFSQLFTELYIDDLCAVYTLK